MRRIEIYVEAKFFTVPVGEILLGATSAELTTSYEGVLTAASPADLPFPFAPCTVHVPWLDTEFRTLTPEARERYRAKYPQGEAKTAELNLDGLNVYQDRMAASLHAPVVFYAELRESVLKAIEDTLGIKLHEKK